MQDRTLIILVVIGSITALIVYLWYSLDVFFVQSSLRASKESVGLLWALSGTGGLVGSLLVPFIGKRRRQKSILLTDLFLRGASLIWYAMVTNYVWAMPAAFLAGLGGDFLIITIGSLIMERTKPSILGKVSAFFIQKMLFLPFHLFYHKILE